MRLKSQDEELEHFHALEKERHEHDVLTKVAEKFCQCHEAGHLTTAISILETASSLAPEIMFSKITDSGCPIRFVSLSEQHEVKGHFRTSLICSTRST